MSANQGLARYWRQIARGYRQGVSVLRAEGVQGVSNRVRHAAAKAIRPPEKAWVVQREDVVQADLSNRFVAPMLPLVPGKPITLNWVEIPAGPGSGGHTTVFRIIKELQARGYENRLYFYDAFRVDRHYYETIARESYGFQGEIGWVADGLKDAHAVVATAWQTAYAVFNSRCAGKRFYFVQDFEPYFYPVGSMSLFAENTYRMGFHAITIGRSFVEKLRSEYGMEVDSFDFGSDVSRYVRMEGVKRNGVAFFARSETPRRGFELGLMTLEVFSKKHPEIELHVYGEKVGGRFGGRCIDHGKVTPARLNEIYNRCLAGLTLSFTNASLVPLEMLAAGCIPVTNDSPYVRNDIRNPNIRFATPEPHKLAEGLSAVVTAPDFETLSRRAAESVQSTSWHLAGSQVDAIFRKSLAAS